ncbi:MAG: cell wall metabolism sensor histidine kinase WalK [Candidatus Obscuribacterales bacterium]|nr:cell wall metabolism sensor histidine kinase WalK [Candidatus Obscuribacterales bacterium]
MKNSLFKPIRRVVILIQQLWGRISTQKRLLLLGLVSISSLVTFTAWILVSHAQSIKSHSVSQFGRALAHALARGGAEALSNSGNLEGLKYYILTEMAQTPAIAYIVLVDSNGQVLLDSQTFLKPKAGSEPIFPYYTEANRPKIIPGVYESPTGYRELTNVAVPMRRNNMNLGVCWVGLDSSSFSIFGTASETKVFLFSIFGLVWFLGALCLAVNYSLINRPLKALSSGASQIAAGRFGHQIQSQGAGREIDQVVSAFNYMSKRLQQYDKQNLDSLMAERNKFISERNKLELVLMSIADGVVVCDRDNKVQIINAAATQLFDTDARDLIGKPLVFCTEGPDRPQICHIIQAFTDTVSPGRMGPVMQQLNIQDRVIRLHIAPISLKGEVLGSVMIMHDITRQADLDRMKNEFISNVSHELRTPITSIKSYVDTICTHGDKLEPDIYKEFMQIIDSEADRLMNLVNEVLELSKLEEADRELEMESQDLRPAAEYTSRALSMMAKDKDISLEFAADDPLPAVLMNRESIERAIINLLTNAIKYTPKGGKVLLSVANCPESKQIKVTVKDNGIGIPEECLENIFDRFYRVEKKVHTIKGTGLGLTIVKNIVEIHGGEVKVESEIGMGSSFMFLLPALDTSIDLRAQQNDAQVELGKSRSAIELNIS